MKKVKGGRSKGSSSIHSYKTRVTREKKISRKADQMANDILSGFPFPTMPNIPGYSSSIFPPSRANIHAKCRKKKIPNPPTPQRFKTFSEMQKLAKEAKKARDELVAELDLEEKKEQEKKKKKKKKKKNQNQYQDKMIQKQNNEQKHMRKSPEKKYKNRKNKSKVHMGELMEKVGEAAIASKKQIDRQNASWLQINDDNLHQSTQEKYIAEILQENQYPDAKSLEEKELYTKPDNPNHLFQDSRTIPINDEQVKQLQAKIDNLSAKNEQLTEELSKRVKLSEVESKHLSILSHTALNQLYECILEEKKQRRLCIVCLEANSRILFLPCRHQKVCNPCSQNLTHCPYCQQHIQEKILPFS